MTLTLVHTLTVFSSFLGISLCGIFLLAQLRRDNSVMDIAYGPLFFSNALATMWWTRGTSPLTTLIVGLIGLWSTRLAIRIYRKNHGKPEDARYRAWRTAWTAHGQFYFLVRSFLQINLLQGIIIVGVALPVMIAASTTAQPPFLVLVCGIALYVAGITIESIADYQLDQFLARKRAGTETAVLMTTGLFHYARRPNYFGETMIWWGLAIIVLPLPFGYLALISPLLITYIVTKVTGPMLEKIFLDKYPIEYREYMRTTSYFIPWVPKK